MVVAHYWVRLFSPLRSSKVWKENTVKRLMILIYAMLLVCGITGTASANSFFLSGVTPAGGWSDVEQSPFGQLCWAAAASNMLAYGGWNGGFSGAGAIFNEFSASWTNVAGNPYYAIEWWLYGTNDKQGTPGWSQLKSTSNPPGDYYPGAVWPYGWSATDVNPSFTSDVVGYITGDVTANRVFTMLLGDPTNGGIHWVTGWGYDGTQSSVSDVYITDSFDNTTKLYDASLTLSGGYYQLSGDPEISGLDLISMGSLGLTPGYVPPNQNPVPEPSTLVLLGIGLACRIGYGWRHGKG